jgi:hypothetical protein
LTNEGKENIEASSNVIADHKHSGIIRGRDRGGGGREGGQDGGGGGSFEREGVDVPDDGAAVFEDGAREGGKEGGRKGRMEGELLR